MPIIDYHNHLMPEQIANDIRFDNITRAWLYGDHYKWRAMRANGVPEKYCTGNATDLEKFEQWAATVPYTLRNPLYHWTHLELQRYFGISELLSPQSSTAIYQSCNECLLQPEYSVKGLLNSMNVKVICTTDDPVDDLAYHKKKADDDGSSFKVFPAFRLDKAMHVDDAASYNAYFSTLELHPIIQ